MGFKRSKTHNNFLLMFLVVLSVVTLISILSFTGCRVSKVTEEEPVISEPESEEEVTEEEVPVGEEEDKIEEEITGNINIFSGLDISDTVGNNRPIAVMIDNIPYSRPPTALSLADILFEVEDESGIIRFIAVYSSNIPELVGPVRSTRPYYAEIASSFDPLYVFWGSWSEGYRKVLDLNMDYFNTVEDITGITNIKVNLPDGDNIYTMRDNTRVAPHNAYVFLHKIQELAKDYNYSLKGGKSPLGFKKDAVDSGKGDKDNITINFSSNDYKANFEYNKEENVYYKYVAGNPHTDRESGNQIKVKNVIVMITNIEGPIDQWGHMVVRTTGTSDIGKAFFFMDGKVKEGTWERTSDFAAPFTFKDKEGNPVFFNRGSTYMAMIKDTYLTYN